MFALVFVVCILALLMVFREINAETMRRDMQERIDRLTEAIARKSEAPLYMPSAPELNRAPVERSSGGWWDRKPTFLQRKGT